MAATSINMHEETVLMQQEMEDAGSTLQAGLRGYTVRQGISEMDEAAQVVQGGVRGASQREQDRAAKQIQAGMRGADERLNGALNRAEARLRPAPALCADV